MTCQRFITHRDLAGLTVKYENFIANNAAVLGIKRNEEGKGEQDPIHPSQHLPPARPEAAYGHLSPSEAKGCGEVGKGRWETEEGEEGGEREEDEGQVEGREEEEDGRRMRMRSRWGMGR